MGKQARVSGIMSSKAATVQEAADPAPPQTKAEADRLQLHRDGWVGLRHGMPDWELRHFVEKLHHRYHQKIVNMLIRWKSHWMEEDTQDGAPGAARPGALVARWVSEKLEGSGVFVYAAHPSQHDHAEDYDYAGPRWYITCSEAAMRHYANRGVAPPPPPSVQEILWPYHEDRRKPWLTEIGWTLVPENSPSQVMHADICSSSEQNAREQGRGRYHHFLWKLCPTDKCTTNVVPGGFSEGCASWDDYKRWSQVSGNAIIFDSEMLHRGAAIPEGKGWTSTLTIQVCAATGWKALNDRVGASLMWYTQPIGWEEGAAVDVLVDDRWLPALVLSRKEEGQYTVLLDSENEKQEQELNDVEGDRLRHRRATDKDVATLAKGVKGLSKEPFPIGSIVDAKFENDKWHEAKVVRRNDDGTYRVVWKVGLSFTDALPASSLKHRMKAEKLSTSNSSSFSPASSDSTPEISRVRRREEGTAEDEPAKRRRAESVAMRVSHTTERLLNRGWVELRDGLPEEWRNWDVIAFVESCYDTFNSVVIKELNYLHPYWRPSDGTGARWGAYAATKATERLKEFGIAVYSPGDSQDQDYPYYFSGPRWYVSVTQRALWQWGGSSGSSKSAAAEGDSKPPAPAPPLNLLEVLHGHSADRGQPLRARGLGWTLAPGGSSPQAVHADIWGIGKHSRTDRTRWPHLLWKRDPKKLCTTEVVPGGFTNGAVKDDDFKKLRVAAAPAILVDSEVLHRGAETKDGPMVSTLSIEFCTASGWNAWEDFQTGGTTKDTSSSLDWRMLMISGDFEEAASARSSPSFVHPPKPGEVKLPIAPWFGARGVNLKEDKRKWEMSC